MTNESDSTAYVGRTDEDRRLVVACLLVVAGTHLPLIPDHLREAPVIGAGFVALVLASLLLAIVVSIEATARTWAAVAAVNLGALVAYLASRTVGLPRLGDDVGNWLDPLSFPALAAEAMALAVALSALGASRAAALPARTGS